MRFKRLLEIAGRTVFADLIQLISFFQLAIDQNPGAIPVFIQLAFPLVHSPARAVQKPFGA